MISKARIYEAPKVVVLYLVPYNQLLSTSNESLGYEDLFSPAPNMPCLDEEPFAIVL